MGPNKCRLLIRRHTMLRGDSPRCYDDQVAVCKKVHSFHRYNNKAVRADNNWPTYNEGVVGHPTNKVAVKPA